MHPNDLRMGPNISRPERLDVAYTRPWSPTWLHMRPLIRSLHEASRAAKGTVLDVGCGNKPYRSLFGSQVSEYFGIDLPPESGTHPDVVGLGSDLPFRAASFETVLCSQVLEHVPNPDRIIGEIARVMKLGGRLILTAPQAWRLHEIPHDYYRYTSFGLSYLLEEHHLKVLRLEPLGGSYALAGQVLLNTLFHSLGKALGPERHWLRRSVILITAPLVIVTNIWFGLWDTIAQDTDDALSYLIVAEKCNP